MSGGGGGGVILFMYIAPEEGQITLVDKVLFVTFVTRRIFHLFEMSSKSFKV